ncbi:MAG: hypothetical protein NW237_05775 [Cyanobacteriota bacterium]|nr:hypothetical protein [Cyanobacteriota bacterium]
MFQFPSLIQRASQRCRTWLPAIRLSGQGRWLLGSLLAVLLAWGLGLHSWAQTPTDPTPTDPTIPASGQQVIPNPQQFRALEQSSSPLSLQRAEALRSEANTAIQSQNYDQAAEFLQQAFNAYNQRSNFHQQLSKSFAGIENQISESQRDLARDAAERRDQVTYELAVVYRAAGKPEEAVAQLVQVIGSQGPTRDLGRQAYQQLLEIGFVDTPFEG